nr:uncharacterized protein LOC109186414 isoform X1 [Ipomoea trifida]
MMNPKYESDIGSTATTPKSLSYYVQSPSRDSNDYADKSSSAQNTPTFDSPLESPSYSPSYGRNYGDSASSRVSGNLRWARGNRRRSEKGWRECKVIDEELDPDNPYGNREGYSIIEKLLIGITGFSFVFAVLCFIIWGASRPYKTLVSLKALNVHSFYYGQGSDHTGVPTRLLTVNCSLSMATHNPATFFGIHVSSTAVKLFYSQLTVATGKVDEYYQPSKSYKELTVRLHGHKVPLYGTGTSLVDLDNKDGVPLMLDFEMRSHGCLVGKLVKTKHTRHVSCSLIIKSGMTKQVVLHKKSCTWN